MISQNLLFQARLRETDVTFVRVPYNMLHNEFEFIGPLGRPYVYQFLSGSPSEIQNYLTLIKPFDEYAWALIAASVISVTIALVLIDTVFSRWSKTPQTGILPQSKNLLQLFAKSYVHTY